jgi:hypothetical protein
LEEISLKIDYYIVATLLLVNLSVIVFSEITTGLCFYIQ